MKQLLAASPDGHFSHAMARLLLPMLLTVALAAVLWIAAAPVVNAARTMTETEMILQGLPPGKTLGNATKPEVLSAVCAAVKKHRPQAAGITRTAIRAHKDYAGDIVATVLRCSGNGDCAFVKTIVVAAMADAPDETSVIQDAALAISPDCADAIQSAGEGDVPAEGPGNFEGGPVGQAPLPGLISGGGGGGVNPQQQLFLVCDNGTQRKVAQGDLTAFLSSHPGAFVGSCQPTPTTNQ